MARMKINVPCPQCGKDRMCEKRCLSQRKNQVCRECSIKNIAERNAAQRASYTLDITRKIITPFCWEHDPFMTGQFPECVTRNQLFC